jgi:CRP-like cAMP-binding protein
MIGTSGARDGRVNAILDSLDAGGEDRIGRHLKRVSSKLGDVLLNPDDPIEYLYFPETAMASAMGITAEGASAEVGLIGWEGVVGVNRLLGARSQPNVINIQMEGEGVLMPAHIAEEEFARGGPFHLSVLRFVNELIVQLGRTAVCNAVHGVEQRLARWLLMCSDRSPDEKLRLTQEFLAMMVAVTRQSISGAAQFLQDQGLIQYSRGVIVILDRPGLEKSSCQCYEVAALERGRSNS